MFKKENTLKKVVDDSLTIVNDFKLSIPYWAYRPTGYKLSDWIKNRTPVIDADLSELMSRGAIDDGNKDVLDNIIDKWIDMERAEVDEKRVNNREMNKNFNMRAKSAELIFQRNLDYCVSELEKTKERVRKYETMMKREERKGGNFSEG